MSRSSLARGDASVDRCCSQLRCGFAEEHDVDQFLMRPRDGTEFTREREGEQGVIAGEQASAEALEPRLGAIVLTRRAVPVATGVIRVLERATVVTAVQRAAEISLRPTAIDFQRCPCSRAEALGRSTHSRRGSEDWLDVVTPRVTIQDDWSFRDADTEALASGRRVSRFVNIEAVARRKLRQLEIAGRLEDLRVPPGNRLEALKRERLGQHSIRVNDQFRLCFRWTDAGAADVEIVDYH